MPVLFQVRRRGLAVVLTVEEGNGQRGVYRLAYDEATRLQAALGDVARAVRRAAQRPAKPAKGGRA